MEIRAPAPGAFYRHCLRNTLQNPNFYASLVYVVYASLIISIGVGAQPDASNAYDAFISNFDAGNVTAAEDPYTYYELYYTQLYESSAPGAVSRTNTFFLAAAIIHIINAFQYFIVWPLNFNPATGKRWSIFAWVQIPEYLNIIEATLYLATACLYPKETAFGLTAYLDSTTRNVVKIELAAALIELLACFMWCTVWWFTFPRGRGRGITLDDPEFIALVLLTIPSFFYVAYNSLVNQDLANVGNGKLDQLYNVADWIYWAGSLFYVLAALRDDGWFPSFWIWGAIAENAGLLPEKSEEGERKEPAI
jgi:hypothetical protein